MKAYDKFIARKATSGKWLVKVKFTPGTALRKGFKFEVVVEDGHVISNNAPSSYSPPLTRIAESPKIGSESGDGGFYEWRGSVTKAHIRQKPNGKWTIYDLHNDQYHGEFSTREEAEREADRLGYQV